MLDLTNAELGNEVALDMLDLLKLNHKVKTVKLGNNKLNDDILPHLWTNLARIETLNLADNSLTGAVI